MRSYARSAVMMMMVFLASMMSPLLIDNEPVEAHADGTDGGPAIIVEVYLKKVYSKQQLDWEWGWDAEVVANYEISQVGHPHSSMPHNDDRRGVQHQVAADFDMDDSNWDSEMQAYVKDLHHPSAGSVFIGGPPVFFEDTFGRESDYPVRYWHAECSKPSPITIEIKSAFEDDHSADWEQLAMEGGAFTAGTALAGVGVKGMAAAAAGATAASGGTALVPIAILLLAGTFVLGMGALTQDMNHDDPQGKSDPITYELTATDSRTLDDSIALGYIDYTYDGETNYYGFGGAPQFDEPRFKTIVQWAYLDQYTPTIGLEFEVKVTVVDAAFLSSEGVPGWTDPQGNPRTCGALSGDYEDLEDGTVQPVGAAESPTESNAISNVTEMLANTDSPFWVTASARGLGPESYPYLVDQSDSLRTANETFDFYYDYFTQLQSTPPICPPMIELDWYEEPDNGNVSDDDDDAIPCYELPLEKNNSADPYNETAGIWDHYNVTGEHRRPMTPAELRDYSRTSIEGTMIPIVEALLLQAEDTIPDFDRAVTFVTESPYTGDEPVTYEQMLGHADELVRMGNYAGAINIDYRNIAMQLLDLLIDYEPEVEPSSVTIEAFNRDADELEEVTVIITEADCDDCEPIFEGQGNEIQVDLPPGEYEMRMMDADGNLIETRTFEAQSGTANAMVIDISKASDVLDMAFYLQGLIIAMVPALVGFAGSRQYLERESESEESEKSATPLWIGVLIFLAVFFMMIG